MEPGIKVVELTHVDARVWLSVDHVLSSHLAHHGLGLSLEEKVLTLSAGGVDGIVIVVVRIILILLGVAVLLLGLGLIVVLFLSGGLLLMLLSVLGLGWLLLILLLRLTRVGRVVVEVLAVLPVVVGDRERLISIG